MPRGDRTGPAGMGPMTGRGAGYCNGYDRPGFMNRFMGAIGRGMGFGRGMGAGLGGGRGRGMGVGRGWFGGAYGGAMPMSGGVGMTAENEKQVLRQQADAMEQELGAIRQRLEELDGKETT